MPDNSLSDEQLDQIVKALGIETLYNKVFGNLDEEEEVEEGELEETDEFGDLDDPDQDTGDDTSEQIQLEYPWPISHTSSPSLASDGSIYIDLTLEFTDIEGAEDYQIRIVPA
jgi:hypothetical protein